MSEESIEEFVNRGRAAQGAADRAIAAASGDAGSGTTDADAGTVPFPRRTLFGAVDEDGCSTVLVDADAAGKYTLVMSPPPPPSPRHGPSLTVLLSREQLAELHQALGEIQWTEGMTDG